jgi:4-hydroxybenzoyl-CoA thioesterase
MSTVFSTPIRVYIEDTDAAGIVYYVNYLKFMERARTEFLRQIGFGHYLHHSDYLFVVRAANIRYRQPARMDDELRATAAIARRGRASLGFHQTILRGDTLLCEGDVEIACVDQDSLKPRALPARLATLLPD